MSSKESFPPSHNFFLFLAKISKILTEMRLIIWTFRNSEIGVFQECIFPSKFAFTQNMFLFLLCFFVFPTGRGNLVFEQMSFFLLIYNLKSPKHNSVTSTTDPLDLLRMNLVKSAGIYRRTNHPIPPLIKSDYANIRRVE